MPQLHLYVPEEVAEQIRLRAEARGQSVSGYLADIVRRDVARGWPADYFERVVGGWQGPLRRPRQGRHERRERM
jgi:hypothetical protein